MPNPYHNSSMVFNNWFLDNRSNTAMVLKTIVILFLMIAFCLAIFFTFMLCSTLSKGTVDFEPCPEVRNSRWNRIGSSNLTVEDQREMIAEMTLEAWNNYRNVSWGRDALMPIAALGFTDSAFMDSGRTIVGSMTTLWIMNLTEPYKQARSWITDSRFDRIISHLSIHNRDLDLFYQVVQEYVGCFLSLYALTSDRLYFEKAHLIVKLFVQNGVVLEKRLNRSWGLELWYLINLTGDVQIRDLLDTFKPVDRNPETMEELGEIVNMYLQTGLKSQVLLNILLEKLSRMALIDESNVELKFQNKILLDCNSGWVIGLGELALNLHFNQSEERSLKTVAENITTRCHHLRSTDSATGLFHEYYRFSHITRFYRLSNYYSLTPQLALTFLVQYRRSRDPKYREYAWDLLLTIRARSRTCSGYVGLLDVDQWPVQVYDYQEPILLSATLKYLYLIFADEQQPEEDPIPLDKWIFNPAGHPLPICGLNPNFPATNNDSTIYC